MSATLPESAATEQASAAALAAALAASGVRFHYDPILHQYTSIATGSVVPAQTVHEWVVEYSANLGKEMRNLTQQLRAGEVTLAQWQLAMSRHVKDAHIASAIAAKGGRVQMTQSDWGRVDQVLRQEYTYLGRLADGIGDGSIPLDGRVLARSEQYGKAATETYANILRREAQRRGADEEQNVLSDADHCKPRDGRPGCAEETARGWVKIGPDGLSLPGERACYANCQCRIITRNSATGEVFG